MVQALVNGKARHHAARPLGRKADDLVLATPVFLKHAFHHRCLERLRLDRLEILLRGQVDDYRAGIGAQTGVEVVADLRAPEFIQVFALRRGQRGAHLQAVGLHQVQRAQHAVQAAQDTHMVLRPGQGVGAQGARLQAVIHIAVKGQQRLARVFLGGPGRPCLVTRHIQARERVAQVHELGNLQG